MDDAKRFHYLAEINSAFTPGAPIHSRDLFAGRTKQVERVLNTIFQRGQHAILFGERGVGKTSLANTLFDLLVLSGKSNYRLARINCSAQMRFEEIWRAIFKQITIDAEETGLTTLDQLLPDNPHPENIRETFQLIHEPSIIIIDEMDRISDSETQAAIADTIKTLSDNSIDTTLIMVGVGDSVDQLIAEHRSIDRNIAQVRMPRMSKYELLEIVDKGSSKCKLAIDVAVRERLADFAQGLPSYTHLLAREAALQAVRSDRTTVAMEDLNVAIREAVDNHLETLLTAYNAAVSAPRGQNFRPVLLACALAIKDDQSFFFTKNVIQPLRMITNEQYEIPAFSRHLKAFRGDSRGPILERRGERRKYRFRFTEPLMEPYVILRGLTDGLITEEQLNHPSPTSTELGQLSLLSASVGPPIEI